MGSLLFSVSGVAEQIGGKEIWHVIKLRHIYTALYINNKIIYLVQRKYSGVYYCFGLVM